MSAAFLFLLLLSGTNLLLSTPIDGNNSEKPRLLDDIAIPDTLFRNADPCTAIGCKWPKSGFLVNVPYEISSNYTQRERRTILKGLKSFHRRTCIRFVPRRPDDQDYIHFFSEEGCWSYVGRQDGGQNISLESDSCLDLATIQHEVLHALGFHHEQVRSDRDKYVRIHFENIDEEEEHNFDKEETNNLGTPYDFNSVMEYSNDAFSKNGKPTIVAKCNPKMKFGHAKKMSFNDIARVNKLYKCKW
ncbi:PREDICTED: low choriolytic enzyme-like [Cyprinodon variegatus]|uniref:Metalloendopeptidase n=1 Tax=Cyprinodon variegatus TaxID=28743 RepID=A0A3Q2FGZ4_CYPVA|nr:PREDICTED: low choriolytic enzyme-like [Cyprinodon variegatus]XP_015240278.1 PREDICTED: low choriolytic enzyme-like [Cyprinodon variegatus]